MPNLPESNDELLGLYEIAELAGVSRTAMANWRVRDARFPKPTAELRSGPVFRAREVRRYLKRRRSHMSYVISTINLKGGVGKTTTTVALAEFLSAECGKKVLVIDLDPQTNLTTVLIGEERWKELNDRHLTLATLFEDALRPEGEPHQFDLEHTLQRRVSPVKAVRSLDLLPSSIDLINVQDLLASMPSGRFYSKAPTDILRRAVETTIDEYDYVLIDCPPNLGIVTLNGLRISDGYIIPTIPDVLSTYGIPQIQRRVKAFADDLGKRIEEIGIIITKYRAASVVHQNTAVGLVNDANLPAVLSAYVPEGNQLAASAEFVGRSTLRQKYGYQGQYETFKALTEEFMSLVEEKV